MCTVTTYRTPGQLVVTMNRDEARSRHEAGLFIGDRRAYPLDARSGGTWCGANDQGLVLTLLNRYQDEQQMGKSSRGSLIPNALGLSSIKEVEAYLQRLNLTDRNPFTLWAMTLKHTAEFVWDNQHLRSRTIKEHPWGFVSSSALDASGVLGRRRQRFEDWQRHQRAVAGEIPGIHLQRQNWDASEAIYMSRELTHTKSISQFVVTRQSLRLDYYNEAHLQTLQSNLATPPVQQAMLSFSRQSLAEFAF